MNYDLKDTTDEVNKLENNFVDTSIIHYLNNYNKEEEIKGLVKYTK